MISLATFRFVGRHAINLLAGIYLATALAHLIGKLMPPAQTWAFFFFSLLWVLTVIAVIIRELHGGLQSLAELGIGTLPPVIVGSVAVLLVARVIAHFEPTPVFSVMVGEWGLIFWIGGYLLMMRDAYHKKKLEEDLAKKPPESPEQPPESLSQAMHRTAPRSDA